jgi:hypothetical protein
LVSGWRRTAIDGHPPWSGLDTDDVVAGADITFSQHAQIEARAVVRNDQCRHARLVHANPQPETRHSRLCDLEQRRADAVAVSDAHFVVGQALHREILAKLAQNEVVAMKILLPVVVALDLVYEDGAMLTAVTVSISLIIAVDVDPPHQSPPLNGMLPDRRAHDLTVPGDIFRHTHIYGNHARHHR